MRAPSSNASLRNPSAVASPFAVRLRAAAAAALLSVGVRFRAAATLALPPVGVRHRAAATLALPVGVRLRAAATLALRGGLRMPSTATLAVIGSSLAATGLLAAPAHGAVEHGQAAPYYRAIESWSSGPALRKAAPGIERVGKVKATTDPPTTEELFSLTYEASRSVTVGNDRAIARKLPAGYPTSGLTRQLDQLRSAWAKQFGKLPGDLDDADLADVATVSAIVGFSVYAGDTKVLTNPGALAVRQGFRQALYGNARFRGLPDARKQTAAEILRVRTLLAYDTYGEERGQNDWKGVREVRAGLRSWMRSGLGVDPAKVKLTATGFARK